MQSCRQYPLRFPTFRTEKRLDASRSSREWKADVTRSDLATYSWLHLDYIEVRRPVVLHARERRITHRTSKVRLTLV